MLIDEIQKGLVAAMKARDQVTKGIYSIVKNKYLILASEKRTKNEEPSDADVLQIIQKTLKELNDELASYKSANKVEMVETISKQIAALSIYLPKMLSEEEIRSEIAKLDDKSMPAVMKHFKTNFAGKVDMGLVNKIARS